MQGTPTVFGCFKCWHGGFWACPGKRVWCNHCAYLPAGHPLRDALIDIHNPLDDDDRDPQAAPPNLRTRTEMHQGARMASEPALLVAGEPSPVQLDGKQKQLAYQATVLLTYHPAPRFALRNTYVTASCTLPAETTATLIMYVCTVLHYNTFAKGFLRSFGPAKNLTLAPDVFWSSISLAAWKYMFECLTQPPSRGLSCTEGRGIVS